MASLIETGELEMKINNIKSKASYLAIGLIALELASIPVSAQIIKKVTFSEPQKVVAVPFPSELGVTKFLVASDDPFAVISENTMGEFDITITAEGKLNGWRFGLNAQMPGQATSCAAQTSHSPTKIYEAERKTAARKGDILTQAVIVEIRYDSETKPDLKIVTEKKARKISSASMCASKLS